ncbi:MAG: PGRS family protein [Minicystis sp.]
MRRSDWLAGVVALLAGSMSASLGACVFSNDFSDCGTWPRAGCPGVGSGTGGSGGMASTSSTGTGGTGGSTPASCIPSENTTAVDDTCGVFVSSTLGDDTNAGTKDKPVKTITAALAKTNGMRVYACGESFTEAVTLSADAVIYGGVDCTAGWTYSAAKKTQLTADPDVVPLTITTSGTKVDVYDLAISAANASKDGGSSIGVLVAQATATFTRCDITAGNGKAGLPGAPYQGSAMSGTIGNKGNDACTASTVLPGDAVTNACAGGDSVSGPGGIGSQATGGPGGVGQPGATQNGGTGEAGGGCGSGGLGDNGVNGLPGKGAEGLGSLSAGGFTGELGVDGKPGAPGQGGGGGGGAKGGTGTGKCTDGTKAGGASGGSGGSGGCGGAGGKGGNGGGSSIALASINGTLLFTGVTLKVGAGGTGGMGGPGQGGGNGGDPGPAGKAKPTYTSLNDACPGGKGGQGGLGGQGGGGRGGHALGIAFTGKAPPASDATTWKVSTPGTPGAGGTGDNTNNTGDGMPGVAADAQQFQ